MSCHDTFLQLVRLAIGHYADRISSEIDWACIEALAEQQGLYAIVLDGVEKLPASQRPPQELLLEWIGEVLQMESEYVAQQNAAIKMSNLFNDNGITTYVLKGFVIAECYPKPEHRSSVDMDCFLLSERGHIDAYELGNRLMEQAGFEVDRNFYKNSTISLPDLTVENHQFMTAVRGNKRLKKFERLLQNFIHVGKGKDKFDGTNMYRPPLIVSALFLIEHAYSHFLHEGLTWRQVLDWMMFSKKHMTEINWANFDALIDKYGFRKFYDSYLRIGKYLLGEIDEDDLNTVDKKMLADIWNDLDLHDFHGIKGKIALIGNTIRAAWKYQYFTSDLMITDLYRRVMGFIFERNPKI